jgi:hypothetical protein
LADQPGNDKGESSMDRDCAARCPLGHFLSFRIAVRVP